VKSSATNEVWNEVADGIMPFWKNYFRCSLPTKQAKEQRESVNLPRDITDLVFVIVGGNNRFHMHGRRFIA
jgi:hypothetical protein